MPLRDRQPWHQLSPLLDELLALPVPDRAPWLADLHARDAALAAELQALLGAGQRAEAARFLGGDAAPGVPLPALRPGQRLGSYEIESALGQGATGSVWRARRTDGRAGGPVALKLLHLALVGRAAARRFEREGAILARLTHPHIAHMLDAGVTPGGQPFLVLELVEGSRIDRHCDALRLNVEQRLALFADVLRAVAHAHSRLVVHRDIKPSNILVTPEGRVKLLDFGIAKVLQEDADAVPITVAGQPAMTPGYAAPEQLQGGPVTTATDVYALGVLLYQLLAGRHPMNTGTRTLAEMLRATVESDAPPLAAALDGGAPDAARAAADRATPLARLRRQLRGDLEHIVASALHRNPSERYQSVAALAEDLRRRIDDEPIGQRRISPLLRMYRFLVRPRSFSAANRR